ncbi:MoaD/ThiS family protein [Candidatus Harpocratesius sp.]
MSDQTTPEFTVKLYGPFYSMTRKKSVSFTSDHNLPTVKEMLQKVVEIFPKLKEYIFEDDHLAEFTTIVINGELISENEWNTVHIHPEDRISLFKGQHGG